MLNYRCFDHQCRSLLTAKLIFTLTLRVKLKELDKIKVGIVNYLNTLPLIYGLKSDSLLDKMEMEGNYPSKVAQQLINGEIDLGLVPVAIIPFLKEYHLVGTHCIGATEPVASVGIFAECPIEEVETLLLDYQSKTSVALAQVLLKHYWKLSPKIEPAGTDFRNQIKGTTAAVVIGDRALEQISLSTYFYDLAEAWQKMTGLPFTFAAWISNKKLPDDFITEFDAANAVGFQHIDEIVAKANIPYYDLKKYYHQNVSYHLDEDKKKAIDLFLTYLKEL